MTFNKQTVVFETNCYLMRKQITENPDLVGFQIMEKPSEFHQFLKDKSNEQGRRKLMRNFRAWVRNQSSSSKVVKFFAIFNEADDFVKNDNWGSWHVKKCVAIPVGDGYEIFFKDVDSIPH